MKRRPSWMPDAGLLTLRVLIGSMMLLGHGLPKLMGFSEKMATFSDPLGVGSTASLTLAVFGEAICAVLLILGLGTRLAAVPLLVTMLVAALVVHSDDPWSRKELALTYAIPALALLISGGGRFSLDAWIRRRRGAASSAAPASEALAPPSEGPRADPDPRP